MATLKLVLRTNKTKADGTAPVFLRITEGRKSRYVSAGIAVADKHWNPDREEVRRSHPQSVAFNDALSRLKSEAQNAALDLKGDRRRALSAQAVKLLPQAEAILGRYRPGWADREALVFPLLERYYDDQALIRRRISVKNVVVNRHLKMLAGMIGTRINLSFHVSRHSLADYARRNTKDLYAISKALGHTKLQTTQVYLRGFDEEAVDGLMDDLFG